MPENADEVSPVKICDDGDDCISSRPAYCDNGEILASAVVGRACCCEEHAGGERERNGGGSDQSPGAPFLEYFQDPGHLTLSKFTAQIRRSGLASDSECEISTENRAHSCHGCIFVPWIAVTG